MDIRKFFQSSAQKSVGGESKSVLSEERANKGSPIKKRPKKMELKKNVAALHLSSEESDGESPIPSDLRAVVAVNSKRRTIISSDEDIDIHRPSSTHQSPKKSKFSKSKDSKTTSSKKISSSPSDRENHSTSRKRPIKHPVAEVSAVALSVDEASKPPTKKADKVTNARGSSKRKPAAISSDEDFIEEVPKKSRPKEVKVVEPPKKASKIDGLTKVDPLAFFNNFASKGKQSASTKQKSPIKKAVEQSIEVVGEEKFKTPTKQSLNKKNSETKLKTPVKLDDSVIETTSPSPTKSKRPSDSDSISLLAEELMEIDKPLSKESKTPKKTPLKRAQEADKSVSVVLETPSPLMPTKTSAKTGKKASPKEEIVIKSTKTTKSPKVSSPVKQVKESITKNSKKPSLENDALPVYRHLKEVNKEELPWVDKHKPTELKHLIGQQTPAAPMTKLLSWLKDWAKHNLGPGALEKKPRPSPFEAQRDGKAFKAVLLSGPPGVGKTTSIVMACKQLGLQYTEMNASDARNKKILDNRLLELLGNTQINQFYGAKKVESNPNTVKHVLIMDEVDGMSGNQDRGGVAELIQMIKVTRIPIICICNDRQSQKIRSLANYCFDLRFQRPRLEQIKGRLKSIVFQEKIKISDDALDKIIQAANQDIRQCIYSLQLLSTGVSNQKGLQTKDVSVNIFEAARNILSAETNLLQKQEMFFTDYSIMPLFVQENYPNVRGPKMNNLQQLKALRNAAESISFGDIVDKKIRSTGHWSLLTTQAMFSCALPCLYLDGYMTEQITFPSWLGRNSTAQKRQRLMRQLATHANLKISGSNHSLVCDYVPVLQDRMYRPLIKKETDGVKEVVEVYVNYALTKDDTEAINELGVWPGREDISKKVSTKAKSALTRALNKEHRLLPYAIIDMAKGRKAAAVEPEVEIDEEGHVIERKLAGSDDENGDDAEDEEVKDMAGVVIQKPSGAKAPSTSGATRGGRGGGGASRGSGTRGGGGRGRGKASK